ncbi:hypothetical protein BC829DRAFT_382137 [Chytridium lagenaria]|nr:hypothetical protein BC829DRAFT_382137 [Chytridium lagenaria]
MRTDLQRSASSSAGLVPVVPLTAALGAPKGAVGASPLGSPLMNPMGPNMAPVGSPLMNPIGSLSTVGSPVTVDESNGFSSAPLGSPLMNPMGPLSAPLGSPLMSPIGSSLGPLSAPVSPMADLEMEDRRRSGVPGSGRAGVRVAMRSVVSQVKASVVPEVVDMRGSAYVRE